MALDDLLESCRPKSSRLAGQSKSLLVLDDMEHIKPLVIRNIPRSAGDSFSASSLVKDLLVG